jgi:hypothetical protein
MSMDSKMFIDHRQLCPLVAQARQRSVLDNKQITTKQN